MRALRRILGDRSAVTAIAVLLTSLLLMQGLVTGWARGAMAAPAVDPLHILCSVSDFGAPAMSPDADVPAKKAAECPCGSLCRLAAAPVPAILGAAEAAAPILRSALIGMAPARQAPVPEKRRNIVPEARAPPYLS